MQIALIPSAYAPMVGGVEELTRRLASALKERGNDVEVWAPVPDPTGSWGATIELDGVVVRRFPMPLWPMSVSNALAAPVRVVRALRPLWRATRAFKPDILHVQCFSTNGVYALLLSVLTRTPLVISLQGETFMDDRDIYGRSVVLRQTLRLGLRRAAAVTACSRFTLDDAMSRFGIVDDAEVIFNGVDLVEPEMARAPSDPDRRTYVLALGRAVPNKGFDLLIDAFRRVVGDVGDVNLVIAGDGSSLGRLRQMVSERSLEGRVELRGRVDRREVAVLMAKAELVVVPSRVEPFGIVVLEAWRAGRPVIASCRGGIAEFVRDGEDGLLVDPLDVDALADALRCLLLDPLARRKLGTHGAERVAEFAWGAIADQYETVYRRVGG